MNRMTGNSAMQKSLGVGTIIAVCDTTHCAEQDSFECL